MFRGRWEKPLAPLLIPSMARRVYTTELGCIACNELSELGAGKEAWLVENPSLICALDTDSLALANRSFVLVLGWSENGDPYNSPVKIRPTLSQIETERITAVEWLVFDEIRVLAVGTSSGYLMIYSLGADLIHKQVSELGGFLVCGCGCLVRTCGRRELFWVLDVGLFDYEVEFWILDLNCGFFNAIFVWLEDVDSVWVCLFDNLKCGLIMFLFACRENFGKLKIGILFDKRT